MSLPMSIHEYIYVCPLPNDQCPPYLVTLYSRKKKHLSNNLKEATYDCRVLFPIFFKIDISKQNL